MSDLHHPNVWCSVWGTPAIGKSQAIEMRPNVVHDSVPRRSQSRAEHYACANCQISSLPHHLLSATMLIQHAFPGLQGGAWQRHERVWCFSNHLLALREKRRIAAAAATLDSITWPQRSGPRTVVNSTSVFACFEPLDEPCSCLKVLFRLSFCLEG